MRLIYFIILIAFNIISCGLFAEDSAADLETHGIEALKRSQSDPDAVISAAFLFGKAAEAYEHDKDEGKTVEMNSFLYWCKKKMTTQQMDIFLNGKEVNNAQLAKRMKQLETVKPAADDAQKYFDRASAFAIQHPAEHLLVAIRFFEVADRFIGTELAVKAQRRSLDEQQIAIQNAAVVPKSTAPPTIPEKPAKLAARMPVPDTVKLKAAELTIKDLFRNEFGARTVDEKQALARKLLQQSIETKDDPVEQYVLLKEAISAAVLGADIETALHSIDLMAKTFEVDESVLKYDALSKIGAKISTPEQAKSLARSYISMIEDAVISDSYDSAIKILASAETTARMSQDAQLSTQIQTRAREVKAMSMDYPKVKIAQQNLNVNPGDPNANLTVGKFMCFAKGDWDKGLSLLTKSGDAALKSLAENELVPLTDAKGQLAVADAWWDYSEKQTGIAKNNIQRHSADLYRKVIPELHGISKAKVEKRLSLLPAQVGKSVDLLAIINPLKNAQAGNWKLENGVLTSNDQNGARIQIPYLPPEEYDFRIVFSRNSGTSAIVQYASRQDREIMWYIGWRNVKFALNEKDVDQNSALKNMQKNTSVIKVRRGSVMFFLNDRLILEEKDEDRLFDKGTWCALDNKSLLGIGSHFSPTSFYSIELQEITGHGKQLP